MHFDSATPRHSAPMNSGMKTLLTILLIAAVGFGAWALLGNGPDAPPVDPGPTTTGEVPVVPQDQQKPAPVRTADPATTTPPDQRTAVTQPVESGRDYGQGLRGRLVDEFGRVVVGSDCYLFLGTNPSSMFEDMLLAQKGVVRPPVAATRSDEAGNFALGLREIPENRVFELRIVGAAHADHVQSSLTLFTGKWWEVGDIKLGAGLVVSGRVVARQGGAPIAGATVQVKPVNQQLTIGPTPGREQGIEVLTAADGSFRIANAATGLVNVAAFGTGFARQEKLTQQIRADAENVFDFELDPGLAIAGVVTDAQGKPVASARYQVIAIAPKTPINVDGRTDREGRFEVHGLVEGPYQVIVNAEGFTKGEAKPVMAGEMDRHIVLEAQGAVRVKVVAKNGRLVERYSVWRKSWHEAQQMYGNMMTSSEVRVNPRDLENGWFRLTGWDPPGPYALEVRAPGFAMAYSTPFPITVGGEDPEVVVEVSEGGSIAGVVQGGDGSPLAGVGVRTVQNEWEENPISDMFGVMMPYKITLMTLQTDRSGAFKLERLTPGPYQLRFEHPDHSGLSMRDVVVTEGQRTDVGTIRLVQGTLVTGTVLLDGAPAPQIKVQVSSVPDPTGQRKTMFQTNVVSDERGCFTLPKRLPPGNYQASAGRQSNPFLMVVDYQKTKQEFLVGVGVAEYRLQFQITSQ